MKRVQLGNKKFIFIKVDANFSWSASSPQYITIDNGETVPFYSELFDRGTWRENVEIVGLVDTKEKIDESMAEQIVEKHHTYGYRNYLVTIFGKKILKCNWDKATASGSLKSLLKSLFLCTGGRYLILLENKRVELLTSEQWNARYPEVVVLDADGWDRKNYQYSWYEEKISFQEYYKRLIMSTIQGKISIHEK